MKENIYENCPLCKTKYEQIIDPFYGSTAEFTFCSVCKKTAISADAYNAIIAIVCIIDGWTISFNFMTNKIHILKAFQGNNCDSMRLLDFEISLYEEFYNDYKPVLEKLIKIFELN